MSPSNFANSAPELYKTLLDTGKDWVCLFDSKGLIKYCSPSFEQLTSYSIEELLSHPELLYEIVHPQDSLRYREYHRHCLSRENSSVIEYRLITKTGSTRWISCESQVIYDKDGLFAGYRFNSRDITEQKNYEHEIEKHLEQTIQLQETIRGLNQCHSLVEVSQKALTAICDILDALHSSITLFDDKKIQLQASRSTTESFLNILDHHNPWLENKIDLQPVCYSNIADIDLNPVEKQTLITQDITALIFIPLVHADRFLGKLIVYFNSTSSCSEQKLRLSQVVAQNLSVIISRFQTLETVNHTEEKYRSIFNNSVEGIYQSSPSGKLLTVNPAMIKMFGYKTEKELLSLKSTNHLYWNPRDRRRLIKMASSDGVLKNAEVKMKRADGKPIWVLLNGRAVKDENGAILYHEGALLDITERKIKEQELWESEQRYQLLSEATFEAIFMSEQGICTGQNKTAEKMFGYTLEEALGRPGTEWIVPEDREKVKHNMLSGYEEAYEVTALRKDGSTFPCEIQGRMFEYRGRPVRMTVLRDITDRIAAQEAQQEGEEQMRSLVRLARTLEQARGFPELAEPLRDEIHKIVGYQNVWIYLLNEDHTSLQLISVAGNLPRSLVDQIQTLKIEKDALLQEIVKSRETIIVHDARIDQRTNKRIVKELGNRSIVSVPIRLYDKQLGFIATGSFGKEGCQTPTPAQQEYLEAVARHLAVVIDRIRFNSENRKTIQKMMELAEFNKNIITSAPVGIITLSGEGNLTSANQAFLEMMGSPGLKETLSLNIYTPEVMKSGITRFFKKTLIKGDSFSLENLPYTSHWGKKLIVNIKGVPQKTKSGRISGIILVIEDVTKRHQAEQEQHRLKDLAQKSENKFRAITTQSMDGIYVIDLHGQYLFVNPAFSKMVGYSPEELLKMTIFDIKANRQKKSAFSKSITSGSPAQVILQRKDKQIFHAEISRKEIEFNGEKCILGAIRDISEKREIEETLKKLSAAIEQSPVSVMITNFEGKIEYVNPRFIELTGYSRNEVIGKDPKILQSGKMSSTTYKELWKTILEGKEWRGELQNRKKNGELYWEEAIISSITNEDGKITHFLAVKADITEQKRAREALKKSEDNYRTVVNNIQEVIFRTDVKGLWTFLNPAWEEITGFTVEESLGTLFQAYVYPEDRELNMKEFKPLLERRKERCFHVVRYLTRNGSFRWIEVQARLIVDKNNRVIGTAGTLTDITDKKRAEEALHESYEFNESLIRAIPFGMDIVDVDGNILFLSQNLKNMFGEDAVNKKCWELYCDDQSQCKNCPLGRKIQVGKTEVLEVSNVMNGKVFQINHTGMIYQGKKAILETFQDISARKQAETALQQQLSFSRALNQISENITGEKNRQRIFDTITTIAGETLQLDLCLIYNINHQSSRVNRLSEWVNKKNKNVHSSLRSYPLEQFNHSHKQLSKNKSWFISDVNSPNTALVKEGSDIFLHKDMGIKSLLWHPLAIDTNGYFLLAFYHTESVHRWGKAELDFTQSLARMAEITLMKMYFLKEQNNALIEIGRLASVVEQSGESIIITDLNGTIEYVNPAFEKITGYEVGESLGQNPRFLKSGIHDEDYYRNLWKTIRSGHVWNGKLVDRKKDGSEYTENALIFPIKDRSGKIINYCKIARDVSHEQELEEQLRQAQKMEAVGTLAGGVAHDFNNLLTVINGYTDLALMKLESTHPSYKDFESIKDAGKKAAGLTSQLLAFSRKQVYKPEIVDVNQIVSSMEKILRRLVTEDIQMQTNLANNLPPVKADPNQLEQILTNLVINARDAVHIVKRRDYKKKITIETGSEFLDDSYISKHPGSNTGPHVFFSVSDNGIGMDEQVKTRIFEPFFTTKSKYKGTGLGLAMVYGIVKQNNGYIFLKSKPGQGTTFKIYWPVTRERIVMQKEKIDARAISGSETILIVEDDDAVRAFTVNALTALGYKVYQASNGQTAIELLRRKKIPTDLIITDLIMPEMNGRELAKQVSSFSPHTRIIFISGYTDDQINHESSLDEEIHFIQKPFSIEVLAREVRRAIEK